MMPLFAAICALSVAVLSACGDASISDDGGGSFPAQVSGVSYVDEAQALSVGYIAGVCEELVEATAMESAEKVLLSVKLRRREGTCRDLGEFRNVMVSLDSPLDGRPVLDVSTQQVVLGTSSD